VNAYEKIQGIDKNLLVLRNSKRKREVKSSIEEITHLLREIQHNYITARKSIPWNQRESLISEYTTLLTTPNYQNVDRSNICLITNQFLEKVKKEILPRRQRYYHFAGSMLFILLIPTIKFSLTLVNKSSKLPQNEKLIIESFDIALPMIIYCWIVSYTIKSGIRKTWAISFSFFATSGLLKTDDSDLFFGFIILFTAIIFLIHVYDNWVRHINKYELFSYYK